MNSIEAMPRQFAGIRAAAQVCIALVLALVMAQFGHAQTLSSINGTVTDSSGSVVENAKVTVKNDNTGVEKTATTSSAGSYTVTDLIPGTYTVQVDVSGFQSSVHNGVGVDVGRASTLMPSCSPVTPRRP